MKAKKEVRKIRFITAQIDVNERGQFKEVSIQIPANVNAVVGVSAHAFRTGTGNLIKTNKHYYGVAAEPGAVDQTFVSSLNNEEMESKCKVFDVVANSGEYVWYLRPVRLGKVYSEINGVNGGINLYAPTPTITLADPDTAYSEDYYVYVSDEEGIGSKQIYVR